MQIARLLCITGNASGATACPLGLIRKCVRAESATTIARQFPTAAYLFDRRLINLSGRENTWRAIEAAEACAFRSSLPYNLGKNFRSVGRN